MTEAVIFAAGFMAALAVAVVIAIPLFESGSRTLRKARKALSEAGEIIAAQQEDIDSLFEITPRRLPNGRFAKRNS